ncbi:hypothetical protein [Sphingobacterium luzhongxinii]|uniref:hypothetical protein n=1 Tax=Sphingobacterium luzhongxinii TaxID=2654181 RepID=UPI0013DC257B|nr:hypothetical protein [Sphingobacterium sp. xlx-73]
MIEPLLQDLRYSMVYKVILGILNLLMLAIIIFLCTRIYFTPLAFDAPITILISLLGFSIFLYYRLTQYSRYVLQWHASLSDQGICIFDPRLGRLDYYWDTDFIGIDSFNLLLEIGPYGPPERMNRTYGDYKISKWLTGHRQIVDSNVAFVIQRDFKHIKLDEIDQTRLIDEGKNTYYRFLNTNKWNMLFFKFCFCYITTALLVFYVLTFDMFYFNPSIALAICIMVSIHLTISFQYWNYVRYISSLALMASSIISVIAFSYIMFDNVHFKNEMFFFIWGIIFGFILTLSICVFVYFHRPLVFVLAPKIRYGILFSCFILISLFSGAFLKVGNIAFSEQPYVWEKGTADSPLMIFIFVGEDPDYVKFDDKDWGSHHMGLFFLNWAEIDQSTQRVEILTYKGRLGIPWMYKNYSKDEKHKAKVIAGSE